MKVLLTLIILLTSKAYAQSTFIPEASGACKVGNTIVIGADEEKNNIYLMNEKGEITRTEVKNFSWDDMEGLAPFEGNQFLATTSHSLTRSGKRKPEREHLMLFQLKDNKIEKIKSWSLRDQLMDFIEKNLGDEVDVFRMRNMSPDQGGLNIEGLAYSNEKIYLGLRSPLTKSGNAIIVTLGHPQKNPQLLSIIKVNLNNKGIRGLDQDKDGLLVLSGPTDDKASSFELHRFDPTLGILGDLRYAGFENVKRPESLVKDNDGSLILFQDFKVEEDQDVIIRLKP